MILEFRIEYKIVAFISRDKLLVKFTAIQSRDKSILDTCQFARWSRNQKRDQHFDKIVDRVRRSFIDRLVIVIVGIVEIAAEIDGAALARHERATVARRPIIQPRQSVASRDR